MAMLVITRWYILHTLTWPRLSAPGLRRSQEWQSCLTCLVLVGPLVPLQCGGGLSGAERGGDFSNGVEKSMFIELDDGKIYRKPLYLMVNNISMDWFKGKS